MKTLRDFKPRKVVAPVDKQPQFWDDWWVPSLYDDVVESYFLGGAIPIVLSEEPA